MARDGCNCCFSFWEISSPFTWLAVQKVKISKQWKKHLEISSFYTSVPKIMIICYAVLEIWHMTHVIVVFHFGQCVFPFTPLTAQRNKTSKKWTWRYHHFTHVYQKLWLDDVRFLRYGGWQVDGRKKWHIEVGALPENFITLKYHVMIYYKNFITSITWHRSQGFLREGVEKQEFSAFPINFFENKQKLFSSNLIVYTSY